MVAFLDLFCPIKLFLQKHGCDHNTMEMKVKYTRNKNIPLALHSFWNTHLLEI